MIARLADALLALPALAFAGVLIGATLATVAVYAAACYVIFSALAR